MTEDEQFAQMNSPAFFGAVGKKIIAAKNAMINADVEATGGCVTHLNGVNIWWQDINDRDTTVKYGNKEDGTPIYEIVIPTQWLATSV